MPRTVPEKLAEYARDWGELGVKAWTRGWWELPVEVGNEIAPLINADDGEIVMMPNVTIAQTAVLSSIDFSKERDTVVMTELDFPSVRYAYAEMAQRLGARVVVVRIRRRSHDRPRQAARRNRREDAPRGRLARPLPQRLSNGCGRDLPARARGGRARLARLLSRRRDRPGRRETEQASIFSPVECSSGSAAGRAPASST